MMSGHTGHTDGVVPGWLGQLERHLFPAGDGARDTH